MRLFVAIDIDDDTRAQLGATRAAADGVLREARVPPRLTWVKPELAHVTLRFIGEASEEQAKRLQEALDGLHVEPFDVTWADVGVFGGWRSPRVLWVAPSAGAETLTQLAAAVNDRVGPVIGPGESRAFKPHLTLARVRESGAGADWRGALTARPFGPTVTRVDHVTLYLSRLSPKGPTYTALSTHG